MNRHPPCSTLIPYPPLFRPPLEICLLHQPNKWFNRNQTEPPLDKSAIIIRPMPRNLGQWRRTMTSEPGRLLLAIINSPCQQDLKRPLPKRQPRKIITVIGQILIYQTVEPVDFPVQLLLHSDHPTADAFR